MAEVWVECACVCNIHIGSRKTLICTTSLKRKVTLYTLSRDSKSMSYLRCPRLCFLAKATLYIHVLVVCWHNMYLYNYVASFVSRPENKILRRRLYLHVYCMVLSVLGLWCRLQSRVGLYSSEYNSMSSPGYANCLFSTDQHISYWHVHDMHLCEWSLAAYYI